MATAGLGWVLSVLLASPGKPSDSIMSSPTAIITGLYRHPVKGLSADSLERVHIANAYDTFPDDRRFALLYEKNADQFEESSAEWLHKENFLCAFTNPRLMAQYQSSYQILQSPEDNCMQTYGLPCDQVENSQSNTATRRLLSLRDRTRNSQELVWGPQDLATPEGRFSLSEFFSAKSGLPLQCVTADSTNPQQKHQFGNTSSGWKHRKDTRTIHLINENTIHQVAEKCKLPRLNPTRFRPNLVVKGWEPWSEFDWIGKSLQIQSATTKGTMKLKILSKTVRCDGVSVDPLDPETVLDIPKLLTKHFPEHGPYLGVYAVIEDPGEISLGDTVTLVDEA
jgi:uncharacterized protein